MLEFLIVGAGGFLGAIARFVIAPWVGQKWGRSFPLGTFIVNVSGSFMVRLIMS